MSDPRPTVAVVGVGVAGLTAAWKLQHTHQVTLFEKRDYIGGHTRTLTVPDGPDAGTPVDTGFIVMNHRNYPHFTEILKEWDVALEDSDMSFSYHEVNGGYTFAGTGLRGLFPSPGHLFSGQHWKLLFELKRFGSLGTKALASGEAQQLSLGEFLDKHRFAPVFRTRYLYAMGAAIWSSPPEKLSEFPAEPYLHFFHNHGLLTLKDRPQWRVVSGGSQTYVRKALSLLNATVNTSTPPLGISRENGKVKIRLPGGRTETFDHVVFGAHADEVLSLLDDPDPEEKRLLGAWEYQPNEVVLHTWEDVMPVPKPCWASWNFSREIGFDPRKPVSVSYWMNRLQNLKTERNYFVTLNRLGGIPAEHVINRTVLRHPQYTLEAMASQAPLRARNGTRNTWLVGSYFGYGFHEDAVRSAVDTVEQMRAAAT